MYTITLTEAELWDLQGVLAEEVIRLEKYNNQSRRARYVALHTAVRAAIENPGDRHESHKKDTA